MTARRTRDKLYLIQTRTPCTWVDHELFSPVHQALITTYMSSVVSETPIKIEDEDAEDSQCHSYAVSNDEYERSEVKVETKLKLTDTDTDNGNMSSVVFETLIKVEDERMESHCSDEITNVVDNEFEVVLESKTTSESTAVLNDNLQSSKELTSPNQCQYCSKCFSTKGNLKQHIKLHTHDKSHQCSFCVKTFVFKHQLVTHERIHTMEIPYQCEHCTKSFARSSHLVNHTRTHTNERPYKCLHCDKDFARNDALLRHTRTHTNERPYKC